MQWLDGRDAPVCGRNPAIYERIYHAKHTLTHGAHFTAIVQNAKQAKKVAQPYLGDIYLTLYCTLH